jgi:uncharacterized protein
MWEHNLTIRQPFGVSVFGSALLKAAPDLASIMATVSRLEQKPSEAFAKAKKGAQGVAEFLRKARVPEVGTSRVSLTQQFRYIGGETKFIGYQARVDFSVIVRELDRVEELLTGLVDSGANELGSLSFQTTRLKELRAEVRKMAIAAAREKASVYSEAAGVELGEVIHIEDVNPNVLQGRGEGHVRREPVVDNDLAKQPLDPGSIDIGAAVLVGFSIKRQQT